MAKKYYKKTQQILDLPFPYFGEAYSNFGYHELGGVMLPDKPTMTDLGEVNDTNIARNLKFGSTPEGAAATASNNQDSFKGTSLSFLAGMGPGINSFVDKQTTDERGIQSQKNAGISGGIRGGLNGLEMGLKTGNPLIAAGATVLGAGIGIYKDVKQGNKQNKAVQENLTNYYASLPENNMTSANPYKMANGGILPTGDMDKDFNSYEGNSHENGGLPIGQNNEVEGGEVNYKNYVFSDRLTPEDKKSTFANLAKRVRGKYKEREYDQAANRAMEQELTSLMQQNEQARIIKEAQDKHLQELENIKQKFANGGYMKNKLKGGGLLDEPPFNDETSAQRNQFIEQFSIVNSTLGLPNNQPVNPETPIPNTKKTFSNTDLYNKDLQDALANSQKASTKTKIGNEEIALGLSMLPALYNNIKGAKASKTILDKAHPELINLEAERYALKNEGAKARLIAGENVRNLGMGSGSSLAGLAAAHSAISSNVMEGLSRSYQNEANTNVGIKNQFTSMNTGIRNQEIVANEQNQAMSDSLKSLGLSDLSRNAQGYLKDKSLKKENLRSNEERTNLINQLFPNYKLGKDPETDKLVVQYINTYYNGK